MNLPPLGAATFFLIISFCFVLLGLDIGGELAFIIISVITVGLLNQMYLHTSHSMYTIHSKDSTLFNHVSLGAPD
jgi:hypothetical protein